MTVSLLAAMHHSTLQCYRMPEVCRDESHQAAGANCAPSVVRRQHQWEMNVQLCDELQRLHRLTSLLLKYTITHSSQQLLVLRKWNCKIMKFITLAIRAYTRPWLVCGRHNEHKHTSFSMACCAKKGSRWSMC